MNSAIFNTGYMVFLTKVKSEQEGVEMPSEMNESYTQIRATNLSALLFKDSSKTPSQLERDAGFCSGGSEIGDDYQSDRIQSSPSSTDTSEDSVDIKLGSIVIPPKRKAFDAIKSENDIPLKKRFKYESVFGHATNKIEQPLNTDQLIQSDAFRPWIPEQIHNKPHLPNEAEILARHPGVTTLHRVPANINDSKVCQDEQPLALVTKKSPAAAIANNNKSSTENSKKKSPIKSIKTEVKPNSPIDDEPKYSSVRSTSQRNYKNMTRERRIEANARERTRVHTISAAFDTLRQSIPSYSNTQKLSKLSILRVACSYILTLSRMTGLDYSVDQSEPSVASCLEEITRTIQTEGKARKRKDEKDE
ncbi:uncharacterized protein LOC129568999 [Sitodiplosis mosellana]|uniref:uncharacterized protein LOC129568999 n=1 Tax=Sitodiplosis mosellana TaxID=263140 RepID=UPI002443D908|nr:uncharacterized protein LOC129568999 [Sitodiplosis mosellana]